MTTARSQRLTADQLARMSDDGSRYELIQGELQMMSPAGGRHGKIAARLTAALLTHVESRQLGSVYAAETGFLIQTDPDTVRAPDVAFVSQARLDSLEEETGYLPLAPDLVVEVVSPRDPPSQVEAKAMAWLDAGTRMVVIVDPETRTVRVRTGEGKALILDEQMEIDGADVVSDWKLPVATLFT